jgi:hypothetical protein
MVSSYSASTSGMGLGVSPCVHVFARSSASMNRVMRSALARVGGSPASALRARSTRTTLGPGPLSTSPSFRMLSTSASVSAPAASKRRTTSSAASLIPSGRAPPSSTIDISASRSA